MNKRSNRRKFLRNLGIGGIGATFSPTLIAQQESAVTRPEVPATAQPKDPSGRRKYNGPYRGSFLERVAFPIGGLGAGMFCLEGTGAVSHMSIRHRPEIFNNPGCFGAIALKGIPHGAKLLEGPVPDWKKFGRPNAGNGLGGSIIGLPHFHEAEFSARFPFAHIDMQDTELPLRVGLTGWSPFIPGDENNSGLPAGALEYDLKNTGGTTLEAVFSYHARNFMTEQGGKNLIRPCPGGFILAEDGTTDKPFLKGQFSIFTDDPSVQIDHCWFRGGWWDPITMVWNTVRSGEIRSSEPVEQDAPGASLYIPFQLAPGQEKKIRLFMTWYVPDSHYEFGKVGKPDANCDPASGCCNSPDEIGLDKYDHNFDGKYYKPWYSRRFSTIGEVSKYWKINYDQLRGDSQRFSEAFYDSTLPPEIMEVVAANLSILKSPTMMRQYDGRIWNFEGCADNSGCCHGSCTHVWNYAQAVCHLFPALERSMRATEFCESQNAEGHQNFRSTLPIRPADHSFHAAADGQLGGIMKVYREWRISGDTDWMKKMFPLVKTSLDYCIRTWDPGRKGIIEEPHHNTYDIEFWGPDGMHCSFYIGSLNALAAMGDALGIDMSSYKELAQKGKAFMENRLYDGEYFIQHIQYTGLKAHNPVEEAAQSFGGSYSEEARKLLEKEGPKYQYGTGCLSDGVLGAWIARMCGLENPIDAKKIESHLLAVHKYNLKSNLSDHANPQRPTYALGEEGGLLLCSWPKGGKLSLPFVYSDEVWTGIEHQVAGHLMMMGHVKEGLEIVRFSRNRYDGRIRNPFNEYECGHWYARALSSYGYLEALTGVRFDAVNKTLYIDSRIGNFTSFLATESGFGTVTWKQGKAVIRVAHGKIPAERCLAGGSAVPFQVA